jgi:large subunit ribosomal protein L29
MKKYEKIGLRELSQEELLERIEKTKKELFELRIKGTIKRLEKPAEIRNLRRRLAILYTIFNEKKS